MLEEIIAVLIAINTWFWEVIPALYIDPIRWYSESPDFGMWLIVAFTLFFISFPLSYIMVMFWFMAMFTPWVGALGISIRLGEWLAKQSDNTSIWMYLMYIAFFLIYASVLMIVFEFLGVCLLLVSAFSLLEEAKKMKLT